MLRLAVSDLGMAAFVKMNGYKCIGRKNRNFYFEVRPGDINVFEELKIEYSNSCYHDFDSCLMALKKFPEYLPEEK